MSDIYFTSEGFKYGQAPLALKPYTVRVYAEELEMDHVDYDVG